MDYPEHNKLHLIKDESQAQGDFLEWLGEQKIRLCVWSDEDKEYAPIYESTEKLLARYHEIDLNKLEQEKRAMLDALQAG